MQPNHTSGQSRRVQVAEHLATLSSKKLKVVTTASPLRNSRPLRLLSFFHAPSTSISVRRYKHLPFACDLPARQARFAKSFQRRALDQAVLAWIAAVVVERFTQREVVVCYYSDVAVFVVDSRVQHHGMKAVGGIVSRQASKQRSNGQRTCKHHPYSPPPRPTYPAK